MCFRRKGKGFGCNYCLYFTRSYRCSCVPCLGIDCKCRNEDYDGNAHFVQVVRLGNGGWPFSDVYLPNRNIHKKSKKPHHKGIINVIKNYYTNY